MNSFLMALHVVRIDIVSYASARHAAGGTQEIAIVPTKHWQRQAAIVYEMMLAICSAIHHDYRRTKHVGAMAEEMLVGMVIRLNDDAGLKPITISAIGRQLSMPLPSVRRVIARLINHRGVIRKSGDGYIGDLEFILARPDLDDYVPEIQEAIFKAAAALAKIRKKNSSTSVPGRAAPHIPC